MLRNAAFHHIELPCEDLELVERFYTIVLGARVYMRRDASRRPNVPFAGTIAEAEENGFQIDATYLKIGDFRIGFLKRVQLHNQSEIDHLAFVIDDEELGSLARRLTEYKIEVVYQDTDQMMIRDPFGLMLELWPRSVLRTMGLL
ncbi:MAG TPA: VOC family protein [Blastocatellia bacterium]|nr:VOC family protein [Blastocatellia bacterium]